MSTSAGNATQTTSVNAPFNLNPELEDYARKTMSGGFFGQNPYTDDLVNRSSQSIINQVQSNFGMAGRNVRGADAAGVAADRLTDLNATIRGPLHEAERQRQHQMFSGLTGPSSTHSIPLQSNIGGNILGGAGLGSVMMPNFPWGGLIGGGLGGLFG